MARKRNTFAKRQREIAKKQKAAEKRERRWAKKELKAKQEESEALGVLSPEGSEESSSEETAKKEPEGE